jgi:hypothetical protein
MPERPKTTLPAARLLLAAALFVPAFVGGVLAGRSLGRKPAAAETKPAPRPADRFELAELSTCQEKLAARLQARAAPSAADAAPGEPAADASPAPVTVEQLEAEHKRCRKSEVLVDAEVCVAGRHQFDALMASAKNGWGCGPKSRVADLIEENFERCATFADAPADVLSDDLTKEQSSRIAEAIRIHKTLTEDELLGRLKEFVFTCTETTPIRPPGLKKPSNPPKQSPANL